MKKRKSVITGSILLAAVNAWASIASVALANEPKKSEEPTSVPYKNGLFVPGSPFIYDPVQESLGDPTIVFDSRTEKAWVFYSQRLRFKTKGPGWYHGGPVGVLSSGFGGFSWLYRGTAEGLDTYAPGRNGYWAPEVIFKDGLYHMFVTFQRGVPLYGGKEAHKYMKDSEDVEKVTGTIHYTSENLLNWNLVGRLPLDPDNGDIIDPCVHPLVDGTWRMWYRARFESGGTSKWIIGYADSSDLYEWKSKGPALIEYKGYAEGPHVFHWKGWYWMLLDSMLPEYTEGGGLAVYRSKDATQWEYQSGILGDRGTRNQDGNADHCSVAVQGDRTFLLYHANSGGQTVGQLAELLCRDGVLSATRDVKPMKLEASRAPVFRGGGAPDFARQSSLDNEMK